MNASRLADAASICGNGGYTAQGIGDFIGLHYAHVSKTLAAAQRAKETAKGVTPLYSARPCAFLRLAPGEFAREMRDDPNGHPWP